MWVERAKAAGDKQRRHYNMTWDLAEQLVVAKVDGVKRADMRKIVLGFLKTAAVVLAADITKTAEGKAASIAITAEYEVELRRCAESPLHVTVSSGWTLTSQDASYLIRVTENFVVSFICAGCGYYGMDWVKSATSYHFRCPLCGKFYRPWSGRTFNKVIVIYDAVTHTQVRMAALWADTKEDNWLHAHAEMYARQVHLPGNLESFLAKQTMELSTLIRQSGVPSDFVRYTWKATTEYEMQPPRFPAETFAKQKAEGFAGQQFTDPDPCIFSNYDALIGILGRMIAGSHALTGGAIGV